jgi:hypothetical protein
MEKYCPQCGETKVRSAFYANKNVKDGLHSVCKVCHLANSKKRRELPGNKERARLAQEKWRKNPNNKRAGLSSRYKAKYGITLEGYEEMLDKQDKSVIFVGMKLTLTESLYMWIIVTVVVKLESFFVSLVTVG